MPPFDFELPPDAQRGGSDGGHVRRFSLRVQPRQSLYLVLLLFLHHVGGFEGGRVTVGRGIEVGVRVMSRRYRGGCERVCWTPASRCEVETVLDR